MPMRQLQMANMLMLGCSLDCPLDDSIPEKLFFQVIEQGPSTETAKFS
jgi:hypothetical protein